MKKSGRAALLALIIAASAAVTAGCSFGGDSVIPVEPKSLSTVTDKTFPKGTVICGVDMEGRTKEQAISILSHQEAEDPEPLSITLTMDDNVYTYTQDDFLFDLNYKQAVNDTYNFLHYGTPLDYYGKKWYLEEHPQEFGASQTVNKQSLEQKLSALADELSRDPVEPQVLDFKNKKFSFSDGEDGISIEKKKLYEEVETQLKESNTVTAEIPYIVTEPTIKKEDLAGQMTKLGTFSTVSTNNANGNANMALALYYINGTTLAPGETFSFHGTVGDSTNGSRGFLPAGAIVNGKLKDEYGGGICQASTTIYGAVARSNLTIVERNNHMWPSSYVPIGQDAAVDYGLQDFQFRNDTEYPVYIECGMEGTTLTATIYGWKDPSYDKIEVTSEKTGSIAQPADIYEEDSSLEKGEIEVYREGREGQTASAQKVFYKDGKVIKTEDLPSSYYSEIATIYHYGPGTKINN